MATAYTIDVGRGTTDLITPVANIQGMSIHLGDLINQVSANLAFTSELYWGLYQFNWNGLSQAQGSRTHIIYKHTVPSRIPRRSTIINATLKLRYLGNVLQSNGSASSLHFPQDGSNLHLDLHGLRLPVVDNTNTTYRYVDSAGPDEWANIYGPAPGYDFISERTGRYDFTLDYLTNNPATPDYIGIDITSEYQYATNTGNLLQLIAFMSQKNALTPTTNYYRPWGIKFDVASHATYLNSAHSYIEVSYRPGIAFFDATSEVLRPINLNGIKNSSLVDPVAHIQVDSPEAGSSSPIFKYWVRSNTPGGTRKRVTITAGRSQISSVNQSASVSGKTLRSIDVYDNASGELTPNGRIRIITDPGDVTKYKFYFTPTGGTETLLAEETTGLTSVTFAADHVFMYTGLRAFRVRAIKWSATAANVSDVWTAASKQDLRTSGYSVNTLTYVYFMAPTVALGDTPDGNTKRRVNNAYTQQLWDITQDIDQGGGVYKTLVPLRDVAGLASGQKVTICDVNSASVVHAEIDTVYASDHGTVGLRDSVLLTTQIGAYDDQAVFTTGILAGALTAPNETLLAVTAPINSSYLDVSPALSVEPDYITIVSPDGATSEKLTVSSLTNSGYRVNLTANTTIEHLAGAYAIPSDTLSSAPFFIQAEIPEGATFGQLLGFIRVGETVVV